MSQDTPASEKEHEASGHKLGKARSEGQIPIGKDIPMVVSLGTAIAAIIIGFGHFFGGLVNLMRQAAGGLADPEMASLYEAIRPPFAFAVLVSFIALIGAVFATAMQTGGKFWWKLAMPDLKKPFSLGKLKKWVNGELFSDLGLATLKAVGIGSVGYYALKEPFFSMPTHLLKVGTDQLKDIYEPIILASVIILAAMIVLAGLELALSRRRFFKQQRMTHDERKRERKNLEGDPKIKRERFKRYAKILESNLASAVPQADVVVVNPTRIAVALRYNPEKDAAPSVVAKGKGEIAKMIRYLAHLHGVPVYEDKPLARMLYKRVEVGEQVPMDTYKAVAAVLAFVYKATRRSGSQGART